LEDHYWVGERFVNPLYADRIRRYHYDQGTMDIQTFMTMKRLSFEKIENAIRAQVGLKVEDAALLTGSLASGVGNARSDLDVYLLTERDLDAYQKGPSIPTHCEGVFIDIEWVPSARLKMLQQALRVDVASDLRNALQVQYGSLDFAHRLLVGVPLYNADRVEEAQRLVDREALLSTLEAQGITGIEAVQIDILGAVEERDVLTASLLLGRLVGHINQILLARGDVTDPNEKWRWRHLTQLHRLGALPNVPGLSSADLLDSLVNCGTLTAPTYSGMRARARETVGLANRVIASAQGLSPERTVISPRARGAGPALRLDVTVRSCGLGWKIGALCGGYELSCNSQFAALALQLDGCTHLDALKRHARDNLGAGAEASRLVCDMIEVLSEFGLLDV
jgi:hypothetical protein